MLARASDSKPTGDAVELAEVAEQVLAQLSEPDRARIVLDTRACTIRGDEALISALFENAIQNALRHGRGDVHVGIAERAGEILVDVRDEGPGVPSADRERLFEPFVRGRNADQRDGHGIGLALIAHVARAHGGSASFEPADRGAHLCVRLPPWAPRD